MKRIFCAALALASACAPATQASGGDWREALEREVYAVVIDSLLASPEVPFVVIADSTMDMVGGLPFPGSRTPVQVDFLAVNRKLYAVPARLPARTRVLRLPYAAYRQGDRYAAFQRFRREYAPAQTFYVLTRPGFADDRKEAILMVNRGCHAYCSSVELVTLDGHGGRWRIVDHDIVVEM
jgi:hypothetical protein